MKTLQATLPLMSKSNKGFTIIELLIVLIIVTVLASTAVVQYGRVFEKARADEAKQNLWEIRVAWGQYVMNHRDPPTSLSDLSLSVEAIPPQCGSRLSFFSYDFNSTHAIATRCVNSGKKPQGKKVYSVTLNLENSTWGGTPGYY
jgi:prepilin-type N-terminal cleavage/methylation domain-containing protein